MNHDFDDVDELFLDAVALCCEADKASASYLQRKLDIGYARAARLLDQLEQLGVISTTERNEPRRVLISDPKEFSFDKASLKKRKRDSLKDKVVPEWAKKNLTPDSSDKSQVEFASVEDIKIPIGFDKKKLITLPITDLGNVYIYPSSLANHLGFIKMTIDHLTNYYNPDTVKFIIGDETKSLDYPNGSPHLLTPVITDIEKLTNALSWTTMEMERRRNYRNEIGSKAFYSHLTATTTLVPRIIIILNFPSGLLGIIDEIYYKLERLLSLGASLCIHLYIVSNLNDKKLSKILASISTKIIFKTHSVIDADLLGTDDAFDLKDKNEFIFIPPYGDIQKLRVG